MNYVYIYMSKMNANNNKLKVGDEVEARFTNICGWHIFPARIVKVNKKTVRVVRIDGNSVWEGDSPDREFTIPIFESVNNGIFPKGSSGIVTPTMGGF